MGRMPSCDEMGLKKGPWTPVEDQTLVSHTQQSGHGNWRALPGKAGLLKCGKSCRLRWTNYLRPGVKRGDFSKEEEDTIICLHGILGNRWSAIAAKLPGRTDNEIKNVWHTHLKKRLNPDQPIKESKRRNRSNARRRMAQAHEPPACSSLGTTRNSEVGIEESRADSLKWLPEIDRTLRCSGESTANRGCAVVEQQGTLKDEDVSFWINLLAEAGKSS